VLLAVTGGLAAPAIAAGLGAAVTLAHGGSALQMLWMGPCLATFWLGEVVAAGFGSCWWLSPAWRPHSGDSHQHACHAVRPMLLHQYVAGSSMPTAAACHQSLQQRSRKFVCGHFFHTHVSMSLLYCPVLRCAVPSCAVRRRSCSCSCSHWLCRQHCRHSSSDGAVRGLGRKREWGCSRAVVRRGYRVRFLGPVPEHICGW
jgi:hypothetical protein